MYLSSLILTHDAHWAIWEPAGRVLWRALESVSLASHLAARPERPAAASGYELREGVAILSLTGPMTKSPTSLEMGTSTIHLRRQIRAALSDPAVHCILLRVDSPGGAVSGVNDLAEDVAIANGRKPVVAYLEDCCCSAAYWAASQAGKVYANPTSIVGSIGAYLVLEDCSRMYENAGIEVHVVRTGEFKGAAVPGTAITSEQLAGFQKTLDSLSAFFVAAVARGRGLELSQVQELADGSVFVGAEAVDRGLVDGIATFDEVLRRAAAPGRRVAADRAFADAALPL